MLVITGLMNLAYMQIPLRELVQPAFFHSAFGLDLDLKLLAVGAMIAVSAVHDFVVAKKNAQLRRQVAESHGSPPADLIALQARTRTLATRLGQLNLLLALVVLFLAAGLVVGGI